MRKNLKIKAVNKRVGQFIGNSVILLLITHLSLSDVLAQNKLTRVISKSVPEQIQLEGVVEAINQATIQAQVTGSIKAINVKTGDAVAANQELVLIDGNISAQSSTSAKAQTEQAQAQLDLARAQFQRQASLFKQNFISKAAYDEAAAQLKTATAQVKASMAQAEAANYNHDYYSVKAPFDGVISNLPINVGELSTFGKPLFTIYDPEALRIKLMLPQTYASNIDTTVSIAWPDGYTHLSNKLPLQIIPAVSKNLNQEVRINLPANIKNLYPGTPIKVNFFLKQNRTSLFIPSTAIIKKSGITGVYVVAANQQISFRKIKAGGQYAVGTEVLSGLLGTEDIISTPASLGAEVKQ